MVVGNVGLWVNENKKNSYKGNTWRWSHKTLPGDVKCPKKRSPGIEKTDLVGCLSDWWRSTRDWLARDLALYRRYNMYVQYNIKNQFMGAIIYRLRVNKQFYYFTDIFASQIVTKSVYFQHCCCFFKGTVQWDFRLPVFFIISPSYSNFSVEKTDSPGYDTPGRLTRRGIIPRWDWLAGV